MGSYVGGHNASRLQTNIQRTTIKNQNRSVDFGRPVITLLRALTSLRSTNPRPYLYLGSSDTELFGLRGMFLAHKCFILEI